MQHRHKIKLIFKIEVPRRLSKEERGGRRKGGVGGVGFPKMENGRVEVWGIQVIADGE